MASKRSFLIFSIALELACGFALPTARGQIHSTWDRCPAASDNALCNGKSKLNELQHCIYENLPSLTNTQRGAFCCEDAHLVGTKFCIFSCCRSEDFSHWSINESATQSREKTFELNAGGEPVCLACWPFEKFFNINECFVTENLDLSNPAEVLVLEDGSMIASMLHPEWGLFLRTHRLFESDQSKAANALIQQPDWLELQEQTVTHRATL